MFLIGVDITMIDIIFRWFLSIGSSGVRVGVKSLYTNTSHGVLHILASLSVLRKTKNLET